LFNESVDINSLYHEWFINFESIVKECIPSQEVTIRPSDKPWMISSIRTAMHKQVRLLRKYRTTFLINDWNKYKFQRHFTVGIIRKEKKSYFTKINAKLNDPKLAVKNWWKTVKSVYGDKVCSQIPPLKEGDNYITDPLKKAQLFNNYFVDQATTTMTNTVPEFSGRFLDRFLTHIEANANEVYNLLNNVDVTKACGYDGIGNRIIKLCAIGLYNSFTKLINISFSLGQFPDQWKSANVIPVFKKNERYFKNNYRPVSLLPSLSKICEKITFVRLYDYLIDIGFLHSFQSGFRPNHSMTSQLTYIIHRIYQCLEEGKEVRVVFLDISKAFDRVWHEGLICKLKYLGIDGPLLAWLQSYVSGRRQRVTLGGKYSEWKGITAGVPQGSVLRPLLFLIYINDMVDDVQSVALLYADDSMLLDIVESPTDSAEKLNFDLASIANWANKWDVIMNGSKSRSMVFSAKK
jgi:hypothetical protein